MSKTINTQNHNKLFRKVHHFSCYIGVRGGASPFPNGIGSSCAHVGAGRGPDGVRRRARGLRDSTGQDRKSRPGRRRPKHHGKRNVLETFLGPLAKSLQNVTPVDFLLLRRQKACDVLHILGSGIRKRRILLRRLILATCQALLAISEQKCLTGGQF